MITWMLAAFCVYIIILLVIGLFASRSQDTAARESNFISGQRSINWWVTAISAHAADMSSWLFMGLPAAIYMHGMVDVWVAIGLVIGMFMSWHYVAPALRRAAAHYESPTLTSYFDSKYKDRSGAISILSACIMTFFFIIYLAAGIKGVGDLLSSTFDLSGSLGGLVTLVVILIYTFMGGFVAAAWVDFFQGVFLLASILITALLGYYHVGGYHAIVDAAMAKGVSLSLLPKPAAFIEILLGPIAWGLGYFGMPHILSKFMAARDVKEMYKSKYIGIAWQILALSGALLSGLVGIAFFTSLANPELLFITMTMQLLPSFIAGFILCGILSATLSTMNAQMLVLGGIVSHDLYKKFYHMRATSHELIWVFRITILFVSAVAFAVAWSGNSSIFDLVQLAWGGLGASFGPLTLLSLHTNTINRHGAFWGIFAGGITSIGWRLSGFTLCGYAINEVLPGFLLGAAVIILVSKITAKK